MITQLCLFCKKFFVLVWLIFKVVLNLGVENGRHTGLHSDEPKISYNTKNFKDLIERIVVLVKVHEWLATHKKLAKFIFQARSNGPLLQRLPQTKQPFFLNTFTLPQQTTVYFYYCKQLKEFRSTWCCFQHFSFPSGLGCAPFSIEAPL